MTTFFVPGVPALSTRIPNGATPMTDKNTSDRARAAADLISSLPDEWVDANKVREIARNVEAATPGFPAEYQGKLRTWARRLNALLPDPAPRTLADMTEEERQACQWMQGRDESGDLLVIAYVRREHCDVIYRDGVTTTDMHDQITPLPDLPHMKWPDSEQEADDPREPEQPRPEDAPDGYWLIRWWGEAHPVPAEKVEGQWWVIGRATMLDAKDVILVSRLVPAKMEAAKEWAGHVVE